jgi:RNA polymerase sigma-70 factor (ECF subfamily)
MTALARRDARMRSIVDEHFRFVARTLRREGVPPSDLDDEIQRTFMIVAGKLADVQHGAERSFLFRVAVNTAAHARRTLARRREVSQDRIPERVEAVATPENLTDRKWTRTLLDGLVDGMHEPLRFVLTLHDLEDVSLAKIAALLGVPRGTVASRLRRARAHIRKRVTEIEPRAAWLATGGVAPIS